MSIHYRDRRIANNAAAKRSRDLKKTKGEEIAFKAAYLEQGGNSPAFESNFLAWKNV